MFAPPSLGGDAGKAEMRGQVRRVACVFQKPCVARISGKAVCCVSVCSLILFQVAKPEARAQ